METGFKCRSFVYISWLGLLSVLMGGFPRCAGAAEVIGYPILNVTATASSSNRETMGPEKTVDGSGLDAMDQHSTEATDMWLSGQESDHWIQFEFDKPYTLSQMWVWNSNQLIERFIGLGAGRLRSKPQRLPGDLLCKCEQRSSRYVGEPRSD